MFFLHVTIYSFCSYACSGSGADAECTPCFPDGCCFDIMGQGNFYCMPSNYCGNDYSEPCGGDRGGCKEDLAEGNLLCIFMREGDPFGHCLWECQYPDGTCPDGVACTKLADDGGACIPAEMRL